MLIDFSPAPLDIDFVKIYNKKNQNNQLLHGKKFRITWKVEGIANIGRIKVEYAER